MEPVLESIPQSSRMCIYYERFILRNWITCLWGQASLNLQGRLETQGRIGVFIQVWRRSAGRTPSSWGVLVFSLKVFNWWDKAYHFSEGNQLYLNSNDLNVTHILKNTLTSTARSLIDQNWVPSPHQVNT